jgi:hypothetical protein
MLKAVAFAAAVRTAFTQDCSTFDPTMAKACGDTPVVGQLCTVSGSSVRFQPTQAAIGVMVRDCKVRPGR